MKISRRNFLLLTAGLAAGCQSMNDGVSPNAREGRVFNAGPAGDYAADGVYSRFSSQGFFIVRRGGQLSALSAICTHRRCKLTPATDQSFFCKCHGSTFDPAGHVTKGPARRDLPQFSTSVDDQGQLLVKISAG